MLRRRSSALPGLRSRRLVAMVMLAGVVALGGGGAGAAPRATTAGRVLVVTLPRVTWDRLATTDAPELSRFLDRAAVASMSTRTVGPRTDSAGAYLTIGAGNRADALDPLTAGQAADRGESTPSGTAAAVYERRTGIQPDGAVVVLSVAEQQARNDSLLYGAVPGALGRTLARAGRPMAVVGNADLALDDPSHREVALGGMDVTGQVAAGRVSDSLLVVDGSAPTGVRTDPGVVRASVEAAWTRAGVVMVEMSDLERAEQARLESTPAQGDAQFRRAVQAADRLFGQLLSTVDPAHDLVMVLGPTAPLDEEQLTVFGMTGPGIERGWARSPTTRRDGFVTLTDVAPTILDQLGIDRPSSMNDTPAASSADGEPLAARRDTMVRDNDRAVFRDSATGPITVAFILLLVVLLLLIAWCVGRGTGWERWLRLCCLVVLAVPSAIFLSGLLPYGPFSTPTFGLAILVVALVVALVASAVGRLDLVAAPLIVGAATVLVLAVDIISGGPLQLNTVFGYSPIVAGRFAGYGNQAFSILTISSLLVATAGWEIWARRRPGSGNGPRIVAVVTFFCIVVVLDGAPMFGADVGGVLASVPAFAVCTLLLAGRPIRARLIALIGVATAGVLVLFAAIDLSRPVESRTHLGRFAAKVLDGDVMVILQRKLEANVSILTSTIWTIVIPVALLFLAYLTWRPNRMLQRINARFDAFHAFGVSALTLGILAWALNDSGVAIPAMMLTVALPYTGYLALQTLQGDPDGGSPTRDSTEGDSTERDTVAGDTTAGDATAGRSGVQVEA